MEVLGSSYELLQSNVKYDVANWNLKIFSWNIKITEKFIFSHFTVPYAGQEIFILCLMYTALRKQTYTSLVTAKQMDLPAPAYAYSGIMEEYS